MVLYGLTRKNPPLRNRAGGRKVANDRYVDLRSDASCCCCILLHLGPRASSPRHAVVAFVGATFKVAHVMALASATDIARPIADCCSRSGSHAICEHGSMPERYQSRARSSVQHRGSLVYGGWQGRGSCASREAIRAMHIAGPAPSGDFWFLLVASKGTRRRQGIRGEVDFEVGSRFLFQADY